jgi:NAD(P)H dehydrogenase (quinone)
LISTNATENRLEQHRHVIDAAKNNDVKHIVYTSMLKASEKSIFDSAVDHFHTEEYIKKTGIPYTMLRNSFYGEIIPLLMGEALQTGNWYYPAANARVNFVSRKDIAEALSTVLISPEAFVNQTYEIASGSSYGFAEIADLASTIKGSTITYTAIPSQAMKEGMKQASLPEPLISLIISGAEAIAAGEVDIVDHSLAVLLKRKPADLKTYLPKLLTTVN